VALGAAGQNDLVVATDVPALAFATPPANCTGDREAAREQAASIEDYESG
jgi:hypothetical protein